MKGWNRKRMKALPPISRHVQVTMKLEDGSELNITHDFETEPVDIFRETANDWLQIATIFTEDNLIAWTKLHYPERICVKTSEYKEIYEKYATPATREDYLRENN